MKHLDRAKFRVLASVEDGTISVETYLTSTANLTGEEKVALVEWMGEKDIDIRPNLSMQDLHRDALYHADVGRRYKPTRRELESGRFECPACHVFMVRVTRKAKDPLWCCGDCGFSIARSDILHDSPEPQEDPAKEPW